MTKRKAVNVVADGHTFWKVKFAKEVCGVFGLEFPKRLVATYKSQKQANPDNHYKGLFFNEGTKFPVSGVNSARLSDYIACKVLGVKIPPAGGFLGRGFGAQANARAVSKKLGIK